jgi:hypothetical protein
VQYGTECWVRDSDLGFADVSVQPTSPAS